MKFLVKLISYTVAGAQDISQKAGDRIKTISTNLYVTAITCPVYIYS